jgi:hypothetical protein
MDTLIISYPTQSTNDALPSSITNALDYFVDMQYPSIFNVIYFISPNG